MDKFYLILYKILCFIVSKFPKVFINALFSFISYLFYIFDKKHTKIIISNLKFCFPNLNQNQYNQIIKKTYQNFGFFVSEFLINQNLNKNQILDKVNFINEDLIINAINTNRPVIVQSAHYGNWEIFPLAVAAKFGPSSVIGRRLDSVVMDQILSKKRQKFDIELIDKNGGAKDIIKALRNRRILGILVDQNTAKTDGIECEFFDKKILHTPAASIFAQKTDAIITSAFTKRNDEDKNKTDIIFTEIIDIKKLPNNAIQEATQIQSSQTQKIIQQDPTEYFWFHKKFKHFYEEIYA